MRRILFGSIASFLISSPTFADENYSWAGFYIGGQAGWMQNDVKYSQNAPFALNILNDYTGERYAEYTPLPMNNEKKNSFSGGVYAGYNFMLSKHFLLGAEADIALYNYKNNDNLYIDNIYPYNYSLKKFYLYEEKVKLSRSVSLRARIGYASSRFLTFATAGISSGTADYNIHIDGAQTSKEVYASNRKSMTGYTVGGGVEYALTDHILLRSEYRYTDYGRKGIKIDGDQFITPAEFKIAHKAHDVRLGIAYKF
ncbi:outer membrane protein [Bartonella tamiae]|uniref:Outer membrane protein beta-barrel domain-containing protein n=1 Tax=Bartonella tamiae Th239 TaxID=1094558 RepID=J0R7H6_9HYPH|nr:outer membrane protein [Bartonella tamiae]EJF91689.1 hypothetical protein ME5_00068 [Bartonella tamiae Th239]